MFAAISPAWRVQQTSTNHDSQPLLEPPTFLDATPVGAWLRSDALGPTTPEGTEQHQFYSDVGLLPLVGEI